MKDLYRKSIDAGNSTVFVYVGKDDRNVFVKLQSMPATVQSSGKIRVMHLTLLPDTPVEEALASIAIRAFGSLVELKPQAILETDAKTSDL